MSAIDSLNLKRQKVLLRADFDVPVSNGQIVDDYRILAALPTIEFLLKRKAAVIIASHLGRPEGTFISNLSLRPVADRLAALIPWASVMFTDEVVGMDIRERIARMRPREVLILGNLRFMKEEERDSDYFARELAALADLYINDAFAVCHRQHASIHAICEYLPHYPGLRLEAEVEYLRRLLSDQVRRPYLAVVGGAKTETKMPALRNLLPRVDQVLLGGVIANTFLRAVGQSISQSACDLNMLVLAETLLRENPSKIILPIDTVQERLGNDNFRIVDIGQQTIAQYRELILGAKTIFWNGDLGVAEKHEYANGTRLVAEAITQADVYSVLAGGDTIAAVRSWRLDHGFDFISTGGGATLSFLAGEVLPGLQVLGLQ